jgi:endoglucanase
VAEKSNDTNKQVTELIKRLSMAVGVTGYTGPNRVQDVVAAELGPYVDEVVRDRLGSVTGIKRGEQTPAEEQKRRRLMLAAHVDEIGAVVTSIDKDFLRFNRVGGLYSRVLMGQEVMVHGRRDLPGLIGSIPPHFQSPGERDDKINIEEMHVDVGLPPAEVAELVQVGDLISFARTPDELLNGLLSGKAMDNRASIAAMILCLQELQKLRHQWDVYAAATADEEWSSYLGATTQAYTIRPDAALVLDLTFADLPDVSVKLNEGPVITRGPSNHPVIRERLVKLCQELELKYQTDVVTSGLGTDAYAVEISREGIPTLLISIPSRYMHSPVETIHPRDVERTSRLMAHFIAGLDEAFVEELVPKL